MCGQLRQRCLREKAGEQHADGQAGLRAVCCVAGGGGGSASQLAENVLQRRSRDREEGQQHV